MAPQSPLRAPRPRAGFTLLELVAVIGIIALMSVVVVAGFSGIMKAVSATSGTDAMRRALNLARQQACVDGEDTYVWVTGVNTFAVVRKAGTISRTASGQRTFSQRTKSRSDPTKDGATVRVDVSRKKKNKNGREVWITLKWIEDDFADLASAGQSFSLNSMDESEEEGSTAEYGAETDRLEELIQSYDGIKVFDMKTATMADVEVPPWFEGDDDAWIFGIDSSVSGFAAGSDYGWLIYPEQSLPGGYVFKGSYSTSGDNAGDFKENYDKKIHFLSNGSVEKGETFELYETAAKKTHKVAVDGTGKVTITIEGDDEGGGGGN